MLIPYEKSDNAQLLVPSLTNSYIIDNISSKKVSHSWANTSVQYIDVNKLPHLRLENVLFGLKWFQERK